MNKKYKEIELLAPAGSKESFYAAINAGCNAIYMGGKAFSARSYANNFTNEEFKDLIRYAHLHNVKINVTVNTLIFDDEFSDAIEFIDFLYKNDVDAVLIQDLGLAYYLHKTYPDLIMHASTQLNCHNVNEARALIDLGFKRIVLAREVSIEEAKKIKELDVEVEVFVHGALCVSYSGNCLMSSFLGNRSGNRGKCAQPCRNEMRVIGNNKKSSKFGISTKDICDIEFLSKLIEIGIDSLKIEGRMKREEYVYQVVSSYRKALDSIYNNKDIDLNKEIEDMKSLFNRGFSKSFLFNESRTKILNQETSSNQGIHLGKVIKIEKDYLYIKLDNDLYLFDGIRINNNFQTGQEVQKIYLNSKDVKSAKKGNVVKIKSYKIKAKINDEVIKTTSKKLNDDIILKIKDERKIPLNIEVEAFINQNLIIKCNYFNHLIIIKGNAIEKSNSKPIKKEDIIDKLSKLGETKYFLNKIDIKLDENAFISLKHLNNLRRELIDEINKIDINFNNYSLNNIHEFKTSNIITRKEDFSFSVQVENEEQLNIVLKYPFKRIFINNRILFNKYKNDSRIYYSLNRIEHHNNINVSKNSIIPYLKVLDSKENIITSPYFNLVNFYSLDFIYSLGVKDVILSYELDKIHINMMLNKYYENYKHYPKVSLPIYGKIDLMIMKSCPIANMEKEEKDHCNLCKKNEYYLLDGFNNQYSLIQDEACTTRLLSSKILYLLDKINEIKSMNISSGIIYFTNESINECDFICKKVFNNDYSKDDLNFKITTGHFENPIL